MNTHLIPFHGETITAIETPDGIFVAVAPLCERLGVSRQGQSSKLNAQPDRWSCKMILQETTAGPRETFCIPVNRIAAWLFTLNANKVKPEARDALIAYQREAADVLDRHFRQRHAEQEEALARLAGQHRRMRAYALAFNPVWNKIARLQEAGIERLQVVNYVPSRTKTWLGVTIEDMEEVGAINPADWQSGTSSVVAQGELDLTPIEAAVLELDRQMGA